MIPGPVTFLVLIWTLSARRVRDPHARLNLFAGFACAALLQTAGSFVGSCNQIACGPPAFPVAHLESLMGFAEAGTWGIVSVVFGALGLLTRQSDFFGRLGTGFSLAAVTIPYLWGILFMGAMVDWPIE